MTFLPNEVASAKTFEAFRRVSFVKIIVVGILFCLHFYTIDAFQPHQKSKGFRHETSDSSLLFAARHNGNDAICPPTNPLEKMSVSRSEDIAKVWANSLELKIPWHAGSRRYLSGGCTPTNTRRHPTGGRPGATGNLDMLDYSKKEENNTNPSA